MPSQTWSVQSLSDATCRVLGQPLTNSRPLLVHKAKQCAGGACTHAHIDTHIMYGTAAKPYHNVCSGLDASPPCASVHGLLGLFVMLRPGSWAHAGC
jgi:hypothetical protein